jgi:hypothetical protein
MRDTATMTDRELLELAAKAAGITVLRPNGVMRNCTGLSYEANIFAAPPWNPLTDDGDALRLAVKLEISITPYPIYSEGHRHSVIAEQKRTTDLERSPNTTSTVELYRADPGAATRRAITRCAAAVAQTERRYEGNGNRTPT